MPHSVNCLPRRAFLVFGFLAAGFVSLSYAQPSSGFDARTLEIHKIEFTGNTNFENNTLNQVINSKETPGGFSKFLYRTFGEKLGSRPELFDPSTFGDDANRLEDFYHAYGFYDAAVSESTHIDTAGQRIDLYFRIRENQRSFVDSVRYRGLEEAPQYVQLKIFQAPMLQAGMPYQDARAAAEIVRVLDLLANNGYPTARFDVDHSAKYKSAASKNFFIVFVFIVGKQYRFGEVSIHVDPPREDITDNLSLRQLDFQPGETYSQEKKISSERNLNRIGLFESARIDHPTFADTSPSPSVPLDVFVRPRPRNELSPEIIASNENGPLNLGLGLGYTNRNFLGDARIFNARVRARTQSLRELFQGRGFRDPDVVASVDLEFQVLQPYLFTRTLSGSWTSTISAEKQNAYILSILRNKMGLSKQFATYTYGFLDWTLERVSPEFLPGISAADSTLRTEDQPQFNSIITFTLQRDKTNDIFSPTEGFFNSISLEESGILPKLLPGIRSGLPFTQYYKATVFGRWYQDLTTSRFNILAIKMKTGYQNKYGESKYSDVSIPLNRRFFSGGSGSVRGWKARELGTMSDELVQFGGNFILEGSAELRVNHFRGFGKLWFIRPENIWAVYFVDFGNIWSDITDFKPKDLAMAAGLGFRYDTFFGPFRIDYGFRLYDPKEEAGKQAIFQKQFWGETIKNGVLHFGIGHAF